MLVVITLFSRFQIVWYIIELLLEFHMASWSSLSLCWLCTITFASGMCTSSAFGPFNCSKEFLYVKIIKIFRIYLLEILFLTNINQRFQWIDAGCIPSLLYNRSIFSIFGVDLRCIISRKNWLLFYGQIRRWFSSCWMGSWNILFCFTFRPSLRFAKLWINWSNTTCIIISKFIFDSKLWPSYRLSSNWCKTIVHLCIFTHNASFWSNWSFSRSLNRTLAWRISTTLSHRSNIRVPWFVQWIITFVFHNSR